ncbi:hypothetical protein [Streptomyces monashensis]|uniref:hypothetical protein n=1 Tax=Streptomyces monashensis TaxID=1678012 RepID=UPI000B32D3B4|nr:hypothetical protein [Streptomyces monashensis]
MALIALAADKGSPGVTTAAVALAAVWPRRVLLAETDPAGGDLVYRSTAAHGGPLNPNTGLLSIAATARRGLVPDQLWDHVQPLSGGLEVLVGLGVAEQAAGLVSLWPTLGRSFAALADSPQAPADVIADCGRVSGDTPAVELFPHAALVLLLSRTEPEALARVRDRAAHLSARLHGGSRGAAALATPLVGVVLIADPAGSGKLVNQVNDMLVHAQTGARVVGTLADDPAGADMLAGRKRGRLDKSLLVRSARKIAADLNQQYGAAWAVSAQAQQGHHMQQPQQGQQPQQHQQAQQTHQGQYQPSYQPQQGQPQQPYQPQQGHTGAGR